MTNYYNPTTKHTRTLNASTAVQKTQGLFIWHVDGVEHSDHNPSHEQMIDAGYYIVKDAVYIPETHKTIGELEDGVIEGETISLQVIKLTDEELADRGEAKFNSDMAEIDMEWTPRMREDIYLLATGQKTLPELQAEYKAATNSNDELPLAAWVAKKQARR